MPMPNTWILAIWPLHLFFIDMYTHYILWIIIISIGTNAWFILRQSSHLASPISIQDVKFKDIKLSHFTFKSFPTEYYKIILYIIILYHNYIIKHSQIQRHAFLVIWPLHLVPIGIHIPDIWPLKVFQIGENTQLNNPDALILAYLCNQQSVSVTNIFDR